MKNKFSTLEIEALLRFISLCISSSVFQFETKFYIQKDLAMGIPLSPILVNITMFLSYSVII